MKTDEIRTKLLALRADFDARVEALLHEIATAPAPEQAPQPRPALDTMTPEDYATHLGVGVSTVYRWVKAGMPHKRIGSGRGMVRILVAKAEDWHASGGATGAVVRDARRDARRSA